MWSVNDGLFSNLRKPPETSRRGFQQVSGKFLVNYVDSFCVNYSFLNLEIQRSQYTRPKVTVHRFAETIQGGKLYEENTVDKITGNFSYIQSNLLEGWNYQQFCLFTGNLLETSRFLEVF